VTLNRTRSLTPPALYTAWEQLFTSLSENVHQRLQMCVRLNRK